MVFLSCVGAAVDARAAKDKLAIYDERADGREQVETALAAAKQEGKRVLVVCGTNWCPWCRQIHALFEADEEIRAVVAQYFAVAWVDVNRRVKPVRNPELFERWVVPAGQRIPAVAVLDVEGETLGTGFVEGTDFAESRIRSREGAGVSARVGDRADAVSRRIGPPAAVRTKKVSRGGG